MQLETISITSLFVKIVTINLYSQDLQARFSEANGTIIHLIDLIYYRLI